jgi:CDP-diacylglycerol---serine O-phosphatidyltransferase
MTHHPHPHDPRTRLVYVLPNLLTAGNLLCGFMAVLSIFEGSLRRAAEDAEWAVYYERSLLFIIGAFVCDMLDGRLARLGGQESPFGREFDSLADIISFGVAPALLVFKIVLYELPHRAGWFIAFVYLACGALRLARFNCLAASGHGSLRQFTGFPIPAAAGLIASLTLLLIQVYEVDRTIGNWKYGLAALMLFLSFMMFSRVAYPSFKALDWHTRRPVRKLLALVLLAALILTFWKYSLAFCFTAYLLYGFLRPRLSRHWRPDFEEEEGSA